MDKENGIDLANITEEEMEDILLEIQGNAMSQFIFNPDLQEILGAGY